MTPGSGFLCKIPSDVSYYFPPDGHEPWEFIFVTFFGLDELASELIERLGHVYALPPGHKTVLQLRSWVEPEFRVVDIAASAGAEMVASLLADLAETKESGRITDRQSYLVRQARQLISGHVEAGMPLSIARLAERLRVTQEHLTRVFHAETGMTPLQQLHREKQSHVCGLLRNTALSIKEIAVQAGFENASNFARWFRHRLQTSPTAFRERDCT